MHLAAPLFSAVQLNSNGIKLGKNLELCHELAEAGLSWVFLQFDGTNDEIYRVIRGRALFADKVKAIENCRKAGLGVVLVPTLVKGVSDNTLGDTLDFTLSGTTNIGSIYIQPMTNMGCNLLDDVTKKHIHCLKCQAFWSHNQADAAAVYMLILKAAGISAVFFTAAISFGPNHGFKSVRDSTTC